MVLDVGWEFRDRSSIPSKCQQRSPDVNLGQVKFTRRGFRQDISVAEGQHLAFQVVAVLKKSRDSEMYQLFWERVVKWQSQLGVADPKLPRKRKMPEYFQKTSNPQDTYHFHDIPKDRYRQIYFEAFDRSINCIEQRFDQHDYKIYVDLQEVLQSQSKEKHGKTTSNQFAVFTLEILLNLWHEHRSNSSLQSQHPLVTILKSSILKTSSLF